MKVDLRQNIVSVEHHQFQKSFAMAVRQDTRNTVARVTNQIQQMFENSNVEQIVALDSNQQLEKWNVWADFGRNCLQLVEFDVNLSNPNF